MPSTTTTVAPSRYERHLRDEKARIEGKLAEVERDLAAAKKAAVSRRLNLPDAGKNLEIVEGSLADQIGSLEHRLTIWQAALDEINKKLAALPGAEKARKAAEGPLRQAIARRDAAFEDAQAALETFIDKLWDVRELNADAVERLSEYQRACRGTVAKTESAASEIWRSVRWPDRFWLLVKGRREGGPTPFIRIELHNDESNPLLRTTPEPDAFGE
jgi:chromosome segregation ATPase